jgi:hypothetical protein
VRTIKLIGLAAIAAISAMAFVGVSSAMAGSTLLCENNTAALEPTLAECGEVKEIHSTTVKFENNAWVAGKAKLLGSSTIECNILVKGTRTSGALTAGAAEFEAELIYTSCNFGCTVTDSSTGGNPQGTILVLKTAKELASVTGDNFMIYLKCPFIYKCHYNASGLTGHGLQPEPAHNSTGKGHVTYSGATVTLLEELSSPFTCPTTGSLHGLFQSLTPLYIRS